GKKKKEIREEKKGVRAVGRGAATEPLVRRLKAWPFPAPADWLINQTKSPPLIYYVHTLRPKSLLLAFAQLDPKAICVCVLVCVCVCVCACVCVCVCV